MMTFNEVLGKRLLMIVLAVFLLLTILPIASGWGVAPARQLADFTQTEQSLSLTLRNTDLDEGYFAVSFGGDLAEFAQYDGALVYLSSATAEVDVPFTLLLPQDLPPGKNTLKVYLRQVESQAADSTMASLLSLVADVIVNVPYEGDHVRAQLHVGQGGVTDRLPITISLLNKGDAAVSVWSDVTIKGPTNQPIDSWTTKTQVLGHQDSGKIETFWEPTYAGVYYAEVIFHYADKSQVLRKEFVVGEEMVVSEGISADKFALGQIVPLTIRAANKWNTRVQGVFAETFVLTKNGQIVQSFKSTPEDMSAFGKNDLLAYWDTSDLLVGEYDLSVVMHFGEKTSQQQYPVRVMMDELVVNLVGKVIEQPGDRDGSGASQYSLLIILLLVVVVTNAIIIFFFKTMKKNKKDEKR